MFLKQYNSYISEKQDILFDLNTFRIFAIDEKLRRYFETQDEELLKVLNENEKDTLQKIIVEGTKDEEKLSEKYQAIKIHISNDCNLRCRYCYAEGGNYGCDRRLMDLETAKRVVDFIKNSNELKNVKYITFFGGEPLLNPQIIEFVCEQTKSGGYKYLLQTNGTILNEYILNILKKYQITVTVSLDGPKEVNDFNRVDCEGKGTYDKIIKNICKMQEEGVRLVSIEATLSQEFIHTYTKEQIVDYIYETTGVRLLKVEYDNALNIDEKDEELWQEIDTFFAKCMGGKYLLDGEAYRILSTFLSKRKQEYICSAGTGILSIDVKGNIFPCQLFMRDNLLRIGTIRQGVKVDFSHCLRKAEREECMSCFARSVCTMCCASGICASKCEQKRMIVKGVLEKFAEIIAEGGFEELYANLALFCEE